MGRLRNNQSGFSAVEGILIIAVVVLVGVVGYMVYKNHYKATQSAPTVANTSSTAPRKTTTPPTAQPVVDDKSTFKITELGIKLVNVPSILSDLNYAVDVDGKQDGSTFAQFSTISLSKLDKSCSPTGKVSDDGGLSKIIGKYDPNAPVGGSPASFVKQFSSFYISYAHPQAACSNNSATEAIHESQMKAFQALATNPSNIEQL